MRRSVRPERRPGEKRPRLEREQSGRLKRLRKPGKLRKRLDWKPSVRLRRRLRRRLKKRPEEKPKRPRKLCVNSLATSYTLK